MAKVLFIEDDPSWQEILQKLLETAGHTSQRATTFEAAIACLSGKQSFDVVVFDLHLGEKAGSDDIFIWLDALIQGISTRKLKIPPIIIVTGLDVTTREVIQAFTEYRGYTFSFFEKKNFHPKEFLQSIKNAVNYSPDNHPKSRSFFQLLAYTLLMTIIVLTTFAVLLWSVLKIDDPKTQQTVLQVGGTVIIVIALFVTTLSQNTKLENIMEAFSKILRGS